MMESQRNQGETMGKQVFINLPVTDLEKSTAFYKALGFTNNPDYSDENASSMMWSDSVVVMLLRHEFYVQFIGAKAIADTIKVSGALFALTMDSKEQVQKFADTAEQYGGRYYAVDVNNDPEFMFGYEVEDPDGHIWEPVWMNV